MFDVFIHRRSWAFEDEIAWAAAWLYRASGEERYLLEAEALYAEFNLQYVNDFSWDGKASGVDVSTRWFSFLCKICVTYISRVHCVQKVSERCLRAGNKIQFTYSNVSQILLYQTTGRAEYGQKLISYCDWVVDQAPRTPKGLLFLSEWGSLRAASNSLFVCVQV